MNKIGDQNIWLNIDKPYGMSSARAVAIVKRRTKAKKVGHAGTLDPLATGVLPIALNKATKTCDYIIKSDKKYYFEISWGKSTDTDDAEGKIIKESDISAKTHKIINLLPKYIGSIEQRPHKFSSIKIKGKKAYELARKNSEFELKKRKIHIKELSLIFNNEEKAGFQISCSKGTYIRQLNQDLTNDLGICGYISKLKRVRVGKFDINSTISLDKLKNITNLAAIDGSISKLRDVLDFMPEIILDKDLALKVKNGQAIFLEEDSISYQNSLVKIINADEVIGLGKICENKLKPTNIFNNL